MTSQDKNFEERTSSKKYMQLNYYGSTTTLGGLPRDPKWLKTILYFLGIAKTNPSNEPKDDESTPDY